MHFQAFRGNEGTHILQQSEFFAAYRPRRFRQQYAAVVTDDLHACGCMFKAFPVFNIDRHQSEPDIEFPCQDLRIIYFRIEFDNFLSRKGRDQPHRYRKKRKYHQKDHNRLEERDQRLQQPVHFHRPVPSEDHKDPDNDEDHAAGQHQKGTGIRMKIQIRLRFFGQDVADKMPFLIRDCEPCHHHHGKYQQEPFPWNAIIIRLSDPQRSVQSQKGCREDRCRYIKTAHPHKHYVLLPECILQEADRQAGKHHGRRQHQKDPHASLCCPEPDGYGPSAEQEHIAGIEDPGPCGILRKEAQAELPVEGNRKKKQKRSNIIPDLLLSLAHPRSPSHDFPVIAVPFKRAD